MIMEQYQMSGTDTKVIEAVLKDENIHYMHMVLPTGERLPVHRTNATVYMTVVRGTLTIKLGGGEDTVVPERTVLKIPFGVEMDARNLTDGVLELFVVKAPAPESGK